MTFLLRQINRPTTVNYFALTQMPSLEVLKQTPLIFGFVQDHKAGQVANLMTQGFTSAPPFSLKLSVRLPEALCNKCHLGSF